MADANKLDPFDIGALEKSLNDSATRVSTIWISFLISSLYLLTAATTVTHRQLLLDQPVKLPVLNIDLPLWGFFFLAPILFVIFHVYVLLQVLLLGRTAATYNEAIDRATLPPPSNTAIRQRLANTLFAQIFAGSPLEREGWLGRLLKAMAWITLAIAPVLILLAIQLAFLPYHSHLATWTHRGLIAAELAIAFLLWPRVLDARRDFEWRGFRQWVFPLASCVLFVFLSLCLATFPSEPHINLVWGHSPSSVQCKRWFSQNFDRLDLPNVDVVDDAQLAKIEEFESAMRAFSPIGRWTRDFRYRDLTCGNFEFADFRRVDLTGARLDGAQLGFAALQNAFLEQAQLPGADLSIADFRGAYLADANLQGSILFQTKFHGAWLNHADLKGAQLHFAYLSGASLPGADLRGAMLDYAQLRGASLDGANLLGASMQGADLRVASLRNASLTGTNLANSKLGGSLIVGSNLWRARNADCGEAEVDDPDTALPASTTRDDMEKFIRRMTAGIPDRSMIDTGRYESRDRPEDDRKDSAARRMRSGLLVTTAPDDTDAIAKSWRDCAEASAKVSKQEHEKKRAAFLRILVCKSPEDGRAISEGLLRNFSVSGIYNRGDFNIALAKGLLGQDGSECAATKFLSPATIDLLHSLIATLEPSAPGMPGQSTNKLPDPIPSPLPPG
jgi:uncharacterized protein YjbI with pentapeptide repeats